MTSSPPIRRTPLRSLAAAASYPLLFAPFWRRRLPPHRSIVCGRGLRLFRRAGRAHGDGRSLPLPPRDRRRGLVAAAGGREHRGRKPDQRRRYDHPRMVGRPDGWSPERGALLYCHGNGGNVSERGHETPMWQAYLKTGVFIFDYPGYGKSGGKPTEAGCYAAADAAYDWLTQKKQVSAERLLLMGRSLGMCDGDRPGVAPAVPGVILCSAFTSFPERAGEIPDVSGPLAGPQPLRQPAQDHGLPLPRLHRPRHGRRPGPVPSRRTALRRRGGAEALPRCPASVTTTRRTVRFTRN